MTLWDYRSRTWARKAWLAWYRSAIRWVKYRARGYRNRQRFRDAIYFHFGGLDVYPQGVAQRPLTHTNS